MRSFFFSNDWIFFGSSSPLENKANFQQVEGAEGCMTPDQE